jgi:hypothetical protein
MSSNSRAIGALIEIMRDNEQAPQRRIESCEHLLNYEAPPEVIEEAKAALLAIEASESVDTKLEALKLLRRVEARRITPGRATREQDVELTRAVEILRRRKALIAAKIFPYPDGHIDDLVGVPVPTLHNHGPEPEPEHDLAVAPRKARQRQKSRKRVGLSSV